MGVYVFILMNEGTNRSNGPFARSRTYKMVVGKNEMTFQTLQTVVSRKRLDGTIPEITTEIT
ncbi:hypothetical protein [Alteribacter aurantiacus]|uniref:hypothetical protein n=1 Tax=Alteribacter aurantiacus TaxID=254410 RepID=UPI0004289685|nr:hypothetical protein [Alteribacter aurantiacus]